MACLGLSALIGLIGLAGYLLDLRPLVALLPGTPVTTVLSAISMCLLAFGMATREFTIPRPARHLGSSAITAVVVVQALVLTEYLPGHSFTIDRLLFPRQVDDWMPAPHPGRPSPQTAFVLLAIGLGILLVDTTVGGYELFRVFAPLCVIAALASALGQAGGVSYLSGTGTVNGISVSSVIVILLLAAGYAMLRPGRRPVRLFFSAGVGGLMTRRLVPTAVIVLSVMAVFIGLADHAGGGLRGLDIMVATSVLLTVMYVALQRTALMLDGIGSEQQHLNATLTHERDMNHAVLDALLDGVIATERDGTVVAVNDRFCEMLGQPAEEILDQRPPYSWWTPERRAEPDFLPDDVLAAKTRVQDETQILCPDGTRMDVARSMSAAFTTSREVALYVVSYRDLTERNQVREERRTLVERLDHFFAMSSDLLCISGADGYFKHLNPAWERVLGHPLHELLARPYLDFVHPDDRSDTRREADKMGRGRQMSASFENRYRHADGSYRWLSWNSTPLPDEGLIYAAARDITDERNERDARAQLAAIVESTDDAVISKTPEGIITNWNTAAERIYGYTAEEAIGRHVALIYAADQLDDVESSMIPVMRGLSVKDHERIGVRKDGTPVYLSLTISPLRDADGKVCGASCIARDITERIREQEALAAARDQALAADRAKSEFVAMVSHEIRTPLNGIIGLNTLMLRTELRLGQKRFADGIDTSAKALLAVINDILDFSKIEAGKVELRAADFDLADVVADAVRVAAENARHKNLEIIGYYPPDLLRPRHGDAGRIRQVLINLLGNAVKFTAHGEVRLEVTPTGDGDECRFTITDTGVGIAPETLDKLFEPFVQADQSSNRSHGGTGLGLTISRQLVDLMGGRLEASSEPGAGSAFSFTVPLPGQARPAARRRQPIKNRLIGKHLLIADRSTASRALLAEHARFWGMIVTAPDDPDTLGRLGCPVLAAAYDFLTVDSRLCENLGGDLTTALRRITNTPHPPRVILLAADPTRADHLAHATGITEVLQQPVDPSALYNCLIQLARPSTAQHAAAAPAGGGSGARGRILVAEDNEINQIVAHDLLTILGYQVDIAHNGEQAIAMATTTDYLAVLMDCQMPKMDGYEATRRLRRSSSIAARRPIIAMTAGAMTTDRQCCLDAGMNDCVTKPIDLDDLDEIITRWTVQPSPSRT